MYVIPTVADPLGLPLGLEAAVMTPDGVNFLVFLSCVADPDDWAGLLFCKFIGMRQLLEFGCGA